MGASTSKLAPEVACRLQACTHFDKREINQIYSDFIRECPSGRLSRDDLLRIYRQFFPFGDPQPFVDRLIKLFRRINWTAASGKGRGEGSDLLNENGAVAEVVVNDNGNALVLEFGDYLTGLSVISRGKLEEKISWAFEFCDGDGDGGVSLEDLVDAMESVQALLGRMLEYEEEEEVGEVGEVGGVGGVEERVEDEEEDGVEREEEENVEEQENQVESIVSSPLQQQLPTSSLIPSSQLRRLLKFFTEADSNGSGRVNKEQFEAAVRERPEIIQGLILYDSVA